MTLEKPCANSNCHLRTGFAPGGGRLDDAQAPAPDDTAMLAAALSDAADDLDRCAAMWDGIDSGKAKQIRVMAVIARSSLGDPAKDEGRT